MQTSPAKEFAALPNRAFAHAATSLGHVDMSPIDYWSVIRLYEWLDEAKVSSRVYSHDGTLAFMFKTLIEKGGNFLGSYGDFLSDLRATATGTTPATTATASRTISIRPTTSADAADPRGL